VGNWLRICFRIAKLFIPRFLTIIDAMKIVEIRYGKEERAQLLFSSLSLDIQAPLP